MVLVSGSIPVDISSRESQRAVTTTVTAGIPGSDPINAEPPNSLAVPSGLEGCGLFIEYLEIPDVRVATKELNWHVRMDLADCFVYLHIFDAVEVDMTDNEE